MATAVSTIETLARRHLLESSASFWSSAEMVDIIIAGIKDLWRDIVDLKQEHYLVVDNTNVSLPKSTSQLLGVPADVHKIYLIEPRDVSNDSPNKNLIFKPLDFNHALFQSARTTDAIDPSDNTIFYAITGQGSPVSSPVIRVAPQVTSAVTLSFSYVPTLDPIVAESNVPIPGEADNALVAWTVAFARAKEREDRSPDPSWIAVYSTEKNHLLQSLGLRQYQEPTIVESLFAELW